MSWTVNFAWDNGAAFKTGLTHVINGEIRGVGVFGLGVFAPMTMSMTLMMAIAQPNHLWEPTMDGMMESRRQYCLCPMAGAEGISTKPCDVL